MDKPKCSISGCDNPVRQKELCNKHRLRLAKYGDPNVAFRPKKAPGEVALHPSGYLRVTGGKSFHRIAAEKMLGRKLLPGEVVHHVDGNPLNNAPENLRVFRSQSEHMAHHEALRRQERRTMS